MSSSTGTIGLICTSRAAGELLAFRRGYSTEELIGIIVGIGRS